MSPAAYLLGFFLLGCVVVLVAVVLMVLDYRRKRKLTAWRKIHIDPEGRGPNADPWQWVPPPHQGREVHLTDEELVARKVRASRNLERWHAYEA